MVLSAGGDPATMPALKAIAEHHLSPPCPIFLSPHPPVHACALADAGARRQDKMATSGALDMAAPGALDKNSDTPCAAIIHVHTPDGTVEVPITREAASGARGRSAREGDSERKLSDSYSPGLRSSWDICDKEFGQVFLTMSPPLLNCSALQPMPRKKVVYDSL
jgi:hypothetical protein